MRVFLLALASLSLCAAAAAQKFSIRLLDANGLLAGDAPRRVATGGAAVGLGVSPAGQTLPVVWTPAGSQLLPLLPGDDAGEASGFNAAGLVVGTSIDVVVQGQLTFFYDHAAAWSGGGPAVSIASLVQSGPPLELKWAVDVDAAGAIVGTGRDAAAQRLRGWRLEGGVLTDLGHLAGGNSVTVADANDAGQVVGTAEDALGRDHAFLWQGGVLTDLHVAGGVPGVVSQAFAVNASGVVVGTAEFDPGGPQWERAAAWTPSGLVDLGLLFGEQSWAWGVNAQGDVVGGGLGPTSTNNATLWRNGVLIDLNTKLPPNSGWQHLLAARAIADDGRIVGEGSYGGALRAFLLEPLCESCASYCTSTPNSSGQAALMSTDGWESVAASWFELRAAPLPPATTGIFYYGPQQVQVPFGNGFRCVGPGALGVFRLPPAVSSAGGVLSTQVDFGDPPSAAGQITPGSTWNFQAWFRDPAAGGAGFDLSDGLQVTFLP